MADKTQFFDDALKGKPSHRLCLDFNTPGGMKEFLEKAKASGIIHSSCEPLCIFAEGPSSVWLVGRRKKQSMIDMN